MEPNEILPGVMQNRTVAELVCDRLWKEIVTGRIQPGQRLVERDLTERLQVSRTPIREALKRLERSNLVIRIPYQGVFVRRLTLEEAGHVYDVRVGLEGIAAQFAAVRADAQQITAMEAVIEQAEEYAAQDRHGEVMLLNVDIHEKIAAATGNPLIVQQVKDLWAPINLVRVRSWEGGRRTTNSCVEHRRIMTAIASRNAREAREAMEAHIQSSWEAVKASMDQKNPVDDEEALL